MAELYAVIAEFDQAGDLLAAAREIRRQGFDRIETFTPFPLDGLDDLLGVDGRGVATAFLLGGLAGAAIGFAMQVGLTWLYPLWIGGRPLVAVPGYMMITFELMVLGAVLSGIVTMMLANRLPKLHHPVFDSDRFTMGEERYYLAILNSPGFDRDSAGRALAALGPVSITDVAAQPE